MNGRPAAHAPFAAAAVGSVTLLQALVLLGVAGRYGYHRDELYFRAAGHHLQLGYPDQGPLTPLAGRISTALMGDNLVALRVPSMIAVAAAVVLTALLARSLGADRRTQAVTAAIVAASPLGLALGHQLQTPAFDLVAWLAAVLAVIAWLRRPGALWPVIVLGAVVGVAVWNKPLIALLLIGVAIGMVVCGRWRQVVSGHALSGALVAIVVAAPVIVWQARHGWPQLDMARAIARDDAAENRGMLVPAQLLILGPLVVPLLIAGVRELWVREAGRLRPLVVAVPATLAVTFLTGGRPYYTAGLLPVLFAAGMVRAMSWRPSARRGQAILLAVNAVFAVLVALPVTPVDRLADSPVAAVNSDVLETVGWPGYVGQMARAVERFGGPSRMVILTENVGEAGAVARFGPPLGLTRVYSAHNGAADWGIPPGSAPALIVGYRDRDTVTDLCASPPRDAGAFVTPYGIDNEEHGAPLWYCARPRRPWAALWPSLRHLG